MSGVERPDWDGTEPPAQAERTDGGRIARPDWNGAGADTHKTQVETEGRPDWPIEPAAPAEEAPKYLAVGEPEEVDEPEEVTPADIVAGLAELDGHDLEIANGAVTAVMDAMPDRGGFESGFDNLPADTQRAILGELALTDRAADADEYETWASDEDLAEFATTQEGSELVSEWGSSADHRLGVIQARLLRMEATTDLSAAWDWFDGLATAQAKAVLRELAK